MSERNDREMQLAAAHFRAGRLAEAEAICRGVLARQPDQADALRMVGLIALRAGKMDEALALLRRATALRPDVAALHSNLANALLLAGQTQESIEPFRRALSLRTDSPEDWNNLGHALQSHGQVREAIEAHKRAIDLRPNFAQAYYNLGAACDRAGDVDAAIAAYENAIRLQPNYSDAHFNRANLLKDTGRLDEAMEGFRQSLRFQPRATAASNLILTISYHPDYDNRRIAEELARFNEMFAKPLAGCILPHRNDRDPKRRLRIGYVSAGFWRHPLGRFLLPLLRNHDHSQFEVFCYSDGTTSDEITERLKVCTDAWHDVSKLSDAELDRQVRQDRIDILVDLSGHMASNRLLVFARKPAPVQVTYLGYPASSGLETIDWRISDNYLDPVGLNDSYYSEKTICLPDCYWCYDPLIERVPVGDLPARRGIVTFGCLNNYPKVSSRTIDLWGRVLQRVPNSGLLLLAPPGTARTRVTDQLSHFGIAPQRVQFTERLSREQYMALYHQIDVTLDTFPYNGHTTSLDALWMGVPLVSLYGNTAVSRGGLSILSHVGLPQLVTSAPNQFVDIVVDLVRDLDQLASMRAGLRQRMEQSPLMDQNRYAANIERLLRLTWEQWCSTRPERL